MKPLVRTVLDPNSGNENRKVVAESGYFDEKEVWANDIYTVFVKRNQKINGMYDSQGKPATICWLSIKRNDKGPAKDWRHFQWIKNQLVDEECEGCEIYPAESKLIDGANQYHLWVFESPDFRFPFGFNEGRIVTQKSFFGETQRPFPKDRMPEDIEECEKRVQDQIEKMKMENLIKKNLNSCKYESD